MGFIEGLHLILAVAVGLLLIYWTLLGICALYRKEAHHFQATKKRKFAIVLQAKSDQSIARSLYSLSGMVYPKNLYDLFVVTDNVLNESTQTAEKLGATVLVTDASQSQDGGVDLPWVFEQILHSDYEQQYDAVITFNADNLVAGNYLEVMNYYLEKGHRIVQGGYKALPKEEHWDLEIARIEFLVHHYVLRLGNNAMGFSAALKSNGSCFETTILRKYAWQNFQQLDEVELGFMMQRDGIEIEFAPEAVIFVDAPIEPRSTEMGHHKMAKNIARFFKGVSLFNKLNRIPIIFTMYPTMIQLLVFSMLMVAISFGTWIFGITSPHYIGIWFSLAAIGMGQLYGGLKVMDIQEKFVKTLLYAPLYIYFQIKNALQSFWKQRVKSDTQKMDDDSQNAVNDKEHIVQ